LRRSALTRERVAEFARLGSQGWASIALEAWSFDMSNFLAGSHPYAASLESVVKHFLLKVSPRLLGLSQSSVCIHSLNPIAGLKFIMKWGSISAGYLGAASLDAHSALLNTCGFM
jgi:hypothetical protein